MLVKTGYHILGNAKNILTFSSNGRTIWNTEKLLFQQYSQHLYILYTIAKSETHITQEHVDHYSSSAATKVISYLNIATYNI